MELEIIRSIFHWVVLVAGIAVLISTFAINTITNKIEERDKNKNVVLQNERDNAIKKNEDNTSKLLNMSAFYSDAANRITNFYLILDLGSTLIKDNFDDFAIYLHFIEDDITFKFESYTTEKQPVENVWYVKSSATEGTHFDVNSVSSFGIQNFNNRSEIIFDLSFASKILPTKYAIKDLEGTFYQVVITSKHKNFIKEIKLNANNWNFVNMSCNSDTWKDFSDNWIEKNSDLSILYSRYEYKHYDSHRIDPVRNNVYRYEVIRTKYEDASKGTIANATTLLNSVDNLDGSIVIEIDNRWLLKDGNYINYFPKTEVNNFKLHIFRDTDNRLKVNIGNSVVSDVTLEFQNDKLFEYDQKIHGLTISWEKDLFTLYINGKLAATNKQK